MFFEVILALVGLVGLLGVAGLVIHAALDGRAGSVPEPYRAGLTESSRISAAAFEAEQALHHLAREEER